MIDLDQPQVMGVLNATPDSFSDGGQFFKLDDARRQANTMANDGAAIIDVGGESTRPGAREISAQEELDRILPLIEAISSDLDVAISVDTSKPEVMREVLRAGVDMINDVFALQHPGAIEAVVNTNCGICLMHMQGVPGSMQLGPTYVDVSAEVRDFLDQRLRACEAAGISADRILLDPGFGFGKTDAHNIEMLAKLDTLQVLSRPILVGLSRKKTLGNLTGRDVKQRMPAGLAAAVLAVERGARMVRTHDVAATVDALKVVAAVTSAGQGQNSG